MKLRGFYNKKFGGITYNEFSGFFAIQIGG
jgi:hypothetical protein